jgi:hypothetical protein
MLIELKEAIDGARRRIARQAWMNGAFVDTNVFIRLTTGDDPVKQAAGEALFQQVEESTRTLRTPDTVIADAVSWPQVWNGVDRPVVVLRPPEAPPEPSLLLGPPPGLPSAAGSGSPSRSWSGCWRHAT